MIKISLFGILKTSYMSIESRIIIALSSYGSSDFVDEYHMTHYVCLSPWIFQALELSQTGISVTWTETKGNQTKSENKTQCLQLCPVFHYWTGPEIDVLRALRKYSKENWAFIDDSKK